MYRHMCVCGTLFILKMYSGMRTFDNICVIHFNNSIAIIIFRKDDTVGYRYINFYTLTCSIYFKNISCLGVCLLGKLNFQLIEV